MKFRTHRIKLAGLTLIAACTLACATTRTVGEQWNDSDITTKLGARYATDMVVDRYRIDIDTLEGAVTLRGIVGDAVEYRRAEEIARWTEGVVSVDNQLEIDPNYEGKDASERFEDNWIAMSVGNKLNLEEDVKARNVDIDVDEGVVTLSGIVEDHEARVVAEVLAFTVDGVVDVVNEIRVEEDDA